MRAYCTICSAEKRRDKEPLPAIERYTSSRIRQVYEFSKQDGVFFFILSGRYGPLLPTDKIPYYDHLLQPEEVREIGYEVAEFVEEHGIAELILFLPKEEDPLLIPYRKVIQWVGVTAGIMVVEHFI